MIWFLIILALVWIIAASVSDIRKSEVPNWLSFGLIFIALSYRGIVSLLSWEPGFFIQGIAGLGVFLVLGYVFYYSRVFAGGDAKLLVALGPVLGFSQSFRVNLNIFIIFLFLILITGAVYGVVWSVVLMIGSWGKFKLEFKKQFIKCKKLFYVSLISAVFLFLILFVFKLDSILFIFAFLIFLLPVLFIYAKSVEESCMIRAVRPDELTEGDWLYENIIIGKKTIKPHWEGLNLADIELIKKNDKQNKKILIKLGIPFIPVFLIAFVFLIVFYLWYSDWEFWQFFNFF